MSAAKPHNLQLKQLMLATRAVKCTLKAGYQGTVDDFVTFLLQI